MKKVYILVLAQFAMIHSYSQAVAVQDEAIRKPGLFRQLPDSIPVDLSSLEALLVLHAGSEVKMEISGARSIPLQGIVVTSSQKFNGRIHTVTIRSALHEGAVFHLTKSIMDNGEILFRGTWIHNDYADIYMLTNNGNEYALVKKKFRELILE